MLYESHSKGLASRTPTSRALADVPVPEGALLKRSIRIS